MRVLGGLIVALVYLVAIGTAVAVGCFIVFSLSGYVR